MIVESRFVRLRDGRESKTLTPLVAPLERLYVPRLAAIAFTFTALSVGRTVYENIRRLSAPPATNVLPFEGDAVRAVRDVVTLAVRDAMGTARRVAVLGGGGVDSSALLAVATSIARERGNTTVFPVAHDWGGEGDDRPHLEVMARHLGVEPVMVPPRDGARFVRAAMVADAAPYNWPTAALERALMAAAREHGAEVVLTGAGGDDLFDGDWTRLHRYRTHRWRRAARARLARSAPSWMRRIRRRRALAARFPWAGPVLAQYIDSYVAIPPPRAPRTPTERWVSFATSAHLAHVDVLNAQLEVASGLPFRAPLLDPRVMQLVASLAPEELLRGDRTRGLFRESMKGLVPDSVRLRPDKFEFEPTITETIREAGGFDVVRDLLQVERAADLGLVEPRVFRSCFEALTRDPHRATWLDVWPLLSVEAFLRTRD